MSKKDNSAQKPKRVSKRTRMQAKTKKSTNSLFDTDGNLSKQNIIEGGRRTRKRLSPSNESIPKRKRTVESRPLIKNAKEKLLVKPKTNWIRKETRQ
ncbi:unnamed protein product [Rhizopus stolonifer]